MNFELLVATSNEHKLKETRNILSPHKITVYGIKDLNLKVKEVKEDGLTYFDNALIKAKAVQEVADLPILADDSGLEIKAMDNKPGINTARYMESHGGKEKTFSTIFNNLKNKDRSARFVCALVLLNVEDKPLYFEGIANEKIGEEAIGNEGFGYDPIFISDELHKCFATISNEEKNAYSHRGKALKKLLTYLIINGYAKA